MPPVHDYVIDNSTGANVRADINNALAAIVSNNSSSSQPTTRYAYMWWADTTTGILKIRNSANDGWIELFQLAGTLTLEDGSASAPGLAFRDDLDTGIFSSAANTFNIATGGAERMELSGSATIFNDGGTDVDFRIEGNNDENLFFLDAGNDRVGIGLSSPTALLDVDGITKTTQLAIGASASIVAATLMQINVSNALSNSSTYPFILNNETNTAANAKGILIKWTGSSGNFSADTGGDYLRCTANGEGFVNAVITGAGLGQFRGGVRFGVDSADANTLHDYEEGTWTPTINGSLSGGVRHGNYVKIGRSVSASCMLTWTSNSGAGGGVGIGGLPFASMTGGSDRFVAAVGYMIGFDTEGNKQLVIGMVNNTTNLYVNLLNDNGSGNAIGAQNCSGNGEIQFTINYQTNA